MTLSRASLWSLVGALALGAVMPVTALAQTPASDVPSPAPATSTAPVPKTPQAALPWRWQGVYFGGIVGYGWATADVTTTTVFNPPGYFAASSPAAIAEEGAQTIRPHAPVYGGEAGYDFQVARLVFGGSFDWSYMNMQDFVVSGTTYPCCAPATFAINQAIDTDYLMTARARVGWAVGRRALIFGTAGIAWMNINYKAQFSDNYAAATESGEIDKLLNTWIYGGGAEYRLTRHVAVKGEYLYANFDPASTTSTNLKATTGSYETSVFTHTVDFNLNVIQGSIKIRF